MTASISSPEQKTGIKSQPLLEVQNLCKYFPVKSGFWGKTTGMVKAVDDVSFNVDKGKTYSLVGESGCGKTTTGRSLLRLIQPTGGRVRFDGVDILSLNASKMRQMRKNMQIIFQDPYSSLNARKSVGATITESMAIHKIADQQEQQHKLEQLLNAVGLLPEYANRYPHEFSGGQRQRICIARALSLDPSFIVCDESVSALDVSIQAQIINLLQQLQDERKLSYLFISHDLAVVRHISDKVGVMYLGQIVEEADCDEIFSNPLHPYTRALLSAVPTINPHKRRKRVILTGDIPRADQPPSGCRFHPRCPECREDCKKGEIPVITTDTGHKVKCRLYA